MRAELIERKKHKIEIDELKKYGLELNIKKYGVEKIRDAIFNIQFKGAETFKFTYDIKYRPVDTQEWILQRGYWNDKGYWKDDAIYKIS